MGKSYTELRKEFEQEWAKNLKLYIKAGMSPEFIAAMRESPSRIEYWDDPRLDNPVEYFSQPKKDLDTQLENILPGLSQRATMRDKEILLLAVAGYTQSEIAVKLHISQVAVLKHLHKFQKLLKRGL